MTYDEARALPDQLNGRTYEVHTDHGIYTVKTYWMPHPMGVRAWGWDAVGPHYHAEQAAVYKAETDARRFSIYDLGPKRDYEVIDVRML